MFKFGVVHYEIFMHNFQLTRKPINLNIMKEQKHNIKSGLLCLIFLFLAATPILAQDGSVTTTSPWATTQTINPGAANEFTIALGGGGALASKKTCGATTAINVPSLSSSNTHFLQGSVPAAGGATINHITMQLSSNSSGSTAYTNYVYYSTDAVFNTANVLGFLPVTFTGYDQACTVNTVTFPAGVKSFRLYKAAKVSGTGPYTVETGTAQGDPQTMSIDNVVVWLNSGTPQPALTVAPTSLTGFTYVSGSGPSANQSFSVSGTNLNPGAITITAPVDYEVSTAAAGPYASTATIANAAGGTLAATPIYTRLVAGRAVGLYNAELLGVSGGGAATSPTVSLSGSVTSGALTPLAAPSVAAGATAPGSNSATANWTAVANASGGYIVQVYQGATLVNTINVAGQASTNIVMTGLTASTAYTYKVTAVGDGLTYSNSPASVASAVFNTTVAASTGGCDIPLYTSDFTSWGAMTGTGSSDLLSATGDGAGFTLFAKPEVNPTTAAPDGTIGVICSDNSTSAINFPPYNFISGGVLQVKFYNSKNSKTLTLSGVTVLSTTIDAQPAGPLPLGTLSTDQVSTGKNFGSYTVTYTFSGSGVKNLVLSSTGKCGEIDITSFKVCTSVGATKYVASTDYASCAINPTGLTFSGIKGSTIKIDKILNVKGWNITGPMTFSVIGTDAAQFTLPISTITQAAGLAGQGITVEFMPATITGVSNAQLIISSAGAPSYCVSLTGVTSTGATPEITTPVQTWNFPTSLIATTSQDIPISGVNLTGPITLSLSGANAGQFSLPTNTVTLAQALAGIPIEVDYLGAISAPLNQNATLKLSSPGAPDVLIPLVGKTYSVPPTTYSLNETVTPGGTGFITQDLGGTIFAAGTTVKVTAVPQTGYKFVNWSDNGSTALVRNILMTSNQNITAVFAPGNGVAITPFNAYFPLAAPTTTGFTARWSADPAATSYTVTVYDKFGVLVQTQAVGNVLTKAITGLTSGTLYTYKVTANTGDVSNIVGPILTAGAAPVAACGTVG